MNIITLENKLIAKRKEFCKNLFFSMSFLFLLYYILTVSCKEYRILLKDYREFYLIGSLCSGYIGFLLSKLEYDYIVISKILLLFITSITIYLCFLHCYLSYTVYVYYIPITIFIGLVTRKNIGIAFGILFFILCLCTRSLALKFHLSHPILISKELSILRLTIELITLSISAFYTIFLIYYFNQFKKIEHNLTKHTEQRTTTSLKTNPSNLEVQHESKFEKLYLEIIDHLNTKKDFKDTSFTIEKLANSLNTNTSYISIALNQYGNKNFNKIVNEYRVNQIKSELVNNNLKQFTLEHIYLNAGFKHQSTFNRVFKEFTGITPSEYIEIIDKNNS